MGAIGFAIPVLGFGAVLCEVLTDLAAGFALVGRRGFVVVFCIAAFGATFLTLFLATTFLGDAFFVFFAVTTFLAVPAFFPATTFFVFPPFFVATFFGRTAFATLPFFFTLFFAIPRPPLRSSPLVRRW